MRILLTTLLIFFSIVSRAQDSIPIVEKRLDAGLLSGHFMPENGNLAGNIYRQSYSLSQLALAGEFGKDSEPLIWQAGDGIRNLSFTAASYMILSGNSRIWGEASYHNTKKKNVMWNESSDFELLYPYIMADSIGGDMSGETYFFRGGYGQEWEKLTWGAELSYRALQEYRDVDPRPKNAVADFKVQLGIGLKVTPRYITMLSVNAGRYKQKGDLTYYSEQGACPSYHLTGLGMDYARFSGTNTSVSYIGNNLGATIDAFPKNRIGLTATAYYNHFSFDKILPNLNSLVMNELNENTVGLLLGWQNEGVVTKYGAKVHGTWKKREGIENLFGDAAGNEYPQIGSVSMYANNSYDATLNGFCEWHFNSGNILSISPLVGMKNLEMKYLYPLRKVNANYLNLALHVNWSVKIKKSLLTLTGNAAYNYCFDADVTLSELSSQETIYNMVIHTINVLQSDHYVAKFGARYDMAVMGKMLFLQSEYKFHYYNKVNIKTHNLNVAIGIVL